VLDKQLEGKKFICGDECVPLAKHHAASHSTQRASQSTRTALTQHSHSTHKFPLRYSIADMAIWPWYGRVITGDVYKNAHIFLDAKNDFKVQHLTTLLHKLFF
jgi:hypothetical protein